MVEKGADLKGDGVGEKPAPAKMRTKQPQNSEAPGSTRGERSVDDMGDAKPKKVPESKKTQQKPRRRALRRPDLWKTQGYENDQIVDSEEEWSEKEEGKGSAKENDKVEVPWTKARAKTKTSQPQQANAVDDKQEKKKKKPRKEGTPEEEEAPQKKKRQRSSTPATFARRKCPSTEFGKAKWHALKRAFTDLIRPQLTTYSAHEDTQGNYDSLLSLSYTRSHWRKTESSKYAYTSFIL